MTSTGNEITGQYFLPVCYIKNKSHSTSNKKKMKLLLPVKSRKQIHYICKEIRVNYFYRDLDYRTSIIGNKIKINDV